MSRLILFKVFFTALILYAGAPPSFTQDPLFFKKRMEALYHSGTITKQPFLDSLQSFVEMRISKGIKTDGKELLEYLSLYKEIAWSNPKYDKYKYRYYNNLINNARLNNKAGEALYYLDQLDKDCNVNKKDIKLYSATIKAAIYIQNRNYKKTISAFEQVENMLKTQFPEITNKIMAFHLINDVASAYAHIADTLNFNKTYNLALKLRALYLKSNTTHDLITVDIFINSLRYTKGEVLYKNPDTIRFALKQMDSIYTAAKQKKHRSANAIESSILNYKLYSYVHLKEHDSARHYLRQIKAASSSIIFTQELNTDYLEAKLLADNGAYKEAYHIMQKGLEVRDSLTAQVWEETDTLLYAFTEAINQKIAFEKSEKEKKHQRSINTYIILATCITLLSVYGYMKYKDKKAASVIHNLNMLANIQVEELEAIKFQERQQEKKRLGAELHDSYASVIAGLKFQMENFIETINETATKQKADQIKNVIVQLYEATRSKSHQMVQGEPAGDGLPFEERIKGLVNYSLPDNKYTKSIVVDDFVLDKESAEVKVELLKIIQEALINILKHANANTIEITLYKEDEMLSMSIWDNGTGFHKKSKNGIGLQSIQKRVKKLNGAIAINTGSAGTSINIKIPTLLSQV